eukprot:750137-Hanusia_phi.AAC.2
MSTSLLDLPSQGMFTKMRARSRTKFAPSYYPTHDTSPPPDQIITTDKSNRLLLRFRAMLKDREARKRVYNHDSSSKHAHHPEKKARIS